MEEKPFTVMITGLAKEGRAGHVKNFLSKLMDHTKKEVGCIAYDIYENTDDPHEFLLFAVWRSQEDFERHNQTPEMQEFKHHLANDFFVKQSKKTYWHLLGS